MFQPPFAWPNQQQPPVPVPQELTNNREPVPLRPPVQRTAQGDADESNQEQPESEQEPEVVSLVDEDEAEQFREFEPEVSDPQYWKPHPSVEKYLDKHFNKLLADKDQEAILKEFPVPDCDAVKAPTLDPEVMEQLKNKGKDLRFGAERNLYKIQEQLLDVTGPLTSLWVELLQPDAEPTKQEIVLRLQRALVLLGSTSHAINVERRRVAWARINLKLKSLAEEDYKDREHNLFGPGFLEKASKKLEVDKGFVKVAHDSSGSSRKRTYEEDPKDLRCFLSKGAPAQYGSIARASHTTS